MSIIIKFDDYVLDNPKIGRLSDGAFRTFMNLNIIAAKKYPRDGSLPTFYDIAWILRLEEKVLYSHWTELEGAELVAFHEGNLFVNVHEPERPRPAEKGSYVYLLYAGNGIYKIGISGNPESRLAQIQTASPYQVSMICAAWFENAEEEEAALHDVYCECRLSGEWFKLNEYHAIDIKRQLLGG